VKLTLQLSLFTTTTATTTTSALSPSFQGGKTQIHFVVFELKIV